jgi:hypothetical protein
MRFLKWSLIVIGLVLLCLPIVASLFWEANKSGEMRLQQEPPEQPKDVAAEGSLSKTVLVVGDSARLWITLRNRSGKTISDVKVSQLDLPGLHVDSLCSSEGAGKKCDQLEKFTIPSIVSQQTIVFWGDATAIEPVEKHFCYALITWATVPGGTRSQTVLSLGGNVIETLWERRLHAVREFMKDFALPLLLVFLGLYVGQWDKNREASRRAYEAEIQQTHLTWNSMLPETYKLAIRYYMKIEAAADGAIRELEKAQLEVKDSSAELENRLSRRHSLYYLVLFERRIKYFLDLNSGFYFKYLAAEDLVASAYARYRTKFFGSDETAKRVFNRVVERADVNQSFDGFLAKLDGADVAPAAELKDVNDAWTHFSQWVSTPNCRLAILELKIFDLVLGFELNRPYAYWYGWQETLRYWGAKRFLLEKIADELALTESEKEIVEGIRQYVKNGEPKPLYQEPSG